MHAPNGTTITLNRTGLWYVTIQAVLNITPVGSSTWNASLIKTGIGAPPISASTLMGAVGFNYYANSSGPVLANVGDTISVQASQNGGATGNFITSSFFACFFTGV